MIIVNFPLLRALDCQRAKSVFNFLQISHGRLRMFHLAWHMPSSVGYSVHLWQDIETIGNIGNQSLCQSTPLSEKCRIEAVLIFSGWWFLQAPPQSWPGCFGFNFPVVLCITCYCSCQECWRGRLWEGHQYLRKHHVAHIIEDMSRFPHTCSIIRVHMQDAGHERVASQPRGGQNQQLPNDMRISLMFFSMVYSNHRENW